MVLSDNIYTYCW